MWKFQLTLFACLHTVDTELVMMIYSICDSIPFLLTGFGINALMDGVLSCMIMLKWGGFVGHQFTNQILYPPFKALVGDWARNFHRSVIFPLGNLWVLLLNLYLVVCFWGKKLSQVVVITDSNSFRLGKMNLFHYDTSSC